jgi:hypothetical protein
MRLVAEQALAMKPKQRRDRDGKEEKQDRQHGRREWDGNALSPAIIRVSASHQDAK